MPYGYLYNPCELVFNTARAAMKRNYGAIGQPWPAGLTTGQVFAEMAYASTTPDIACNYFEKAFIPVTVADRAYANA
jgi:hypothetical protein